ncbi:MAG: oligosaccharide flippase family protein [Bacillota bacterium]
MGIVGKSSVGEDALKLTASKLITTAISFVTVMLLARLLSLEEYGTYAQLLLVTNVMTSIFMLGLPFSINYFLARAESVEESQIFLSNYYTLSTILSLIVGAILFITAPVIVVYFENEFLKQFVYFLVIFPWAKIIITSIENVLIVYKKASMLMVYRIVNSVALLGIILIVSLFDLNFQIYMILFILVEIIFALSVYLIVQRISRGVKVSLDLSQIKKILVFSLPIGLASVVGIINIELDKLMIGKFLDTEHLAIYTNASRELPITIIAASLTAVLLPQLARLLKHEKNGKAIELWGNATALSYIFICYMVAGIFVFAPDVITLLYSDRYLDGVSVFRIYSITLLLKVTYFGMVLNAKGKTKFILYSSIFSLCLNVTLNFILFYLLGFEGPAYSTLLSQLIINLIQLIYTTKVVEIPLPKIFPWRSLGFNTVVNVVFAFSFSELKIALPFDIYLGSSLLESILLGLLWGTIYLFIYKKVIKNRWKVLNKGE